jgi:hypothetical protein
MPRGYGSGPRNNNLANNRGRGRGRGQGGGVAQGPGGECLCPNCNYREQHQIGVPCYNKKCPKCGAPMTRA